LNISYPQPTRIQVRQAGKFDEVVGYDWEPIDGTVTQTVKAERAVDVWNVPEEEYEIPF
jgi:hypothetical protein